MSISKPLGIASIAFLLLSPIAAIADRGAPDQFITQMDGNTLSGTNAAGLAFNVSFLDGGRVAYTNVTGAKVDGKWHLDRDGNICIVWPAPVDAMAGCFRMSIDGDNVIWRSSNAGGRAMLRGNVADNFLESQQ